MRYLTWLVLLVTACSTTVEPSSPPPNTSMNGNWSMTIDLSGEWTTYGQVIPIACAGTASLTVSENPNNGLLSGEFQGHIPCSQGTRDWSGFVTGTRTGSRVEFQDGFCVYTGDLTNYVITGTVTCSGDDTTMTGTFRLDR